MKPPIGTSLLGVWGTGLYLQTPPFSSNTAVLPGAVSVDCYVTACSSWNAWSILLNHRSSLGSNNASDVLEYNPSTQIWHWTVGATAQNGSVAPWVLQLDATQGLGENNGAAGSTFYPFITPNTIDAYGHQVVNVTTGTTAAATDNNHIVVLKANSIAYTLPNPQPSVTCFTATNSCWSVTVQAGAAYTGDTISIASGMTVNAQTVSSIALLPGQRITINADRNTSTNYTVSAVSAAGTGLVATYSNGQIVFSLASSTITVNSVSCSLGGSCTVSSTIPTPTISAIPELVCAVAADTSIASTSITAASSTGSGPYSVTYTMSAVPGWMQLPGASVGVTGASPSTYNFATGTVVSATSTTVTVSLASSPGTWTSGGSMFLACANQANNAVSATPYTLQNLYAVPANYWANTSTTPAVLNLLIAGAMWTPSSPPAFTILAYQGSTELYSPPIAATAVASQAGAAGSMIFNLSSAINSIVLSVPAGPASWQSLSSSLPPLRNSLAPTTVSTAAANLTFKFYFSAATAGSGLLVYDLQAKTW